jgi:hypothetical protein
MRRAIGLKTVAWRIGMLTSDWRADKDAGIACVL